MGDYPPYIPPAIRGMVMRELTTRLADSRGRPIPPNTNVDAGGAPPVSDFPPDVREPMDATDRSIPDDPWGRPTRKSLHWEMIDVPRGGGDLFHARTPAEKAARWEALERAVSSLRDHGDSYIFQMSLGYVDPRTMTLRVQWTGLEVSTPSTTPLPPVLDGVRKERGMMKSTHAFEDEVIPGRSRAELWSDMVRVHMPKNIERTLADPPEKVLRLKHRKGPAPELPPVERRFLSVPPVVNIRVEDEPGAFEVVIDRPSDAIGELVHSTGGQELTVFACVIEVLRRPSGEQIYCGVVAYRLKFPQPTVPGSSTHSVKGTTMYIHVPKAL